ncbi:hypothetical protein MACH05_23890 [Qipengyuania nanhaisediminis]
MQYNIHPSPLDGSQANPGPYVMSRQLHVSSLFSALALVALAITARTGELVETGTNEPSGLVHTQQVPGTSA